MAWQHIKPKMFQQTVKKTIHTYMYISHTLYHLTKEKKQVFIKAFLVSTDFLV